MELIIDISDEEYKTLSTMSEKEKVNELSYYERIIANGKPVYEHERLKGEPLVEHCIGGDCKGCHNQCTWFICPICHCKVEKEDNFCKHCGADIRGEENE